ncbi:MULTISPECIES: hypothetical protein [Actinoalloteichus]|uniref:Uncharacterized protein n=1 Tax=Actinoalloteichus caeruleus DSM 43889 TaxID=1120930 RepID=A0ABT1JGJ7_ACTCY|nr:hypothetical protein [Actinoalloteichus caeruleus]MCP2331625.1 hypothetical protein [Actinoalloteichus caeruleus DSM 43889]
MVTARWDLTDGDPPEVWIWVEDEHGVPDEAPSRVQWITQSAQWGSQEGSTR